MEKARFRLPTGFWKINPIVVKEVRSRMRGPRAFLTLTVILLLLSVAMYAMLQVLLATAQYNNVLSPQVGQYLFASLVFLELAVIAIITPAITAGAISNERERQTYEMLIATPLHPAAIVWGKLLSALSYVALLIFAGIPLASVVFIFGGVALREMVKALAVLLVVAVAFGMLGIFLSALLQRTGRATIASFLIVGGLIFGPLFGALLVAAIRNGQPPRWILAPSPISALSAAIAPSMQQMGGNELFYILGGIFNLGVNQVSFNSIPRPMYHYTLPLYLVLTMVLFFLSVRLVRPTHTWRMRRRETLLSAGSIVLVIGLIAAGFLLTADRYEWVQQENNPFAAREAMSEPAIAGPVTAYPVEQVVVAGETGSIPFSEEDTAQILAALVRQLLTVKVEAADSKVLYLVNSAAYPVQVTAAVEKNLADLPYQWIWVKSPDDLPRNPYPSALEDGNDFYITFDGITILEEPDKQAVEAAGTIYTTNSDFINEIYRLEKINDTWQIVQQ